MPDNVKLKFIILSYESLHKKELRRPVPKKSKVSTLKLFRISVSDFSKKETT